MNFMEYPFCQNIDGNDSGSIPDQGQNCKSIGKIKDLAIAINQKSSKRFQIMSFMEFPIENSKIYIDIGKIK